ncbi:MAG: hypothetical protein LBH49_01660 [Puniceicoccales bacterium]|jgi:hypothetical protein|nr:hypothetical protein [Puniceicoccales bacterium]
MRLFFPSNDRRSKDQDKKLSALLQIKKAEIPSRDFWANFDTKLHSKLVTSMDEGVPKAAIHSFFMTSRSVVSFISCVACSIAIIMAFEIQDHPSKRSQPKEPPPCVKHFVKNELTSITGCHDLVAYTSGNHNTTCYVSNSLGTESSCWPRPNNSF